MTKVLLVLLCLPFHLLSQGLIESQIPFSLNSDADTQINVVDQDDDNDGVLDNADFSPLNGTTSISPVLSAVVLTTADAGLRNNSTSNANANYGSEAITQTRNNQRLMIMKFDKPSSVNITSVTLNFYGSDENDPVAVYLLPYNSWAENTITYNNTSFAGQQLIGTTPPPVIIESDTTLYTMTIPVAMLPNATTFSILIYDENDPTGKVENFYSKETSGKAPRLTYQYTVPQVPRVESNLVNGKDIYVNGSPLQVGFRLTQAPTSTVWLPFQVSDPTIAGFTTNEVLVFTPTNWNTFQNISITPESVGNFNLWLRPLHSNDTYYNGNNPDDINSFRVQAVSVTIPNPISLTTGSILNTTLSAISNTGGLLDYRVVSGPIGLNITEYGGRLSFHPLSNQLGDHPFTIEITDSIGNVSTFNGLIKVTNGGVTDPIGTYVNLNAAANPSATGTVIAPYNTIASAVARAASIGGGPVYVRGAEHELTTTVNIPNQGTTANPIIIQPLPGEHVKINFGIRSAFELLPGSKHIEIKGFEIDGGTDLVDFWCIVSQALYGDASIPRGGGICIGLDGDSINIRNNYIHHAYQKALEIRGARYLDVNGNIIHDIATTSLSGGHGIMRQQAGPEIFTPDNLNDHRWDLNGNLIFNVEQRIYSWVPSKNFMEMTLDEGKPILIDDPKDTDGIADIMKARIANNVVAFGSIDNIRLKSTPNLEVSNNNIFTHIATSDGVTDKGGDTNTPQFLNFMFKNNAVQTTIGRTAIEINDAIAQASSNPGSMPTVVGNYAAGGVVSPVIAGLNTVSTNALFTNPLQGNFSINPSLGLPASLGVSPAILSDLSSRAASFGTTVKWGGWLNDNLKLSQTIIDNIPGAYDNIAGNETVFTNYGHFNNDTTHIEFNVVNGVWKSINNINSNNHEFRLSEEYSEWMRETLTHHLNSANQRYPRVRWGDSYIKQNYKFEPNWLVVSTIHADTNTVVYGDGVTLTIDGDLLVHFDGITPSVGDYYDLMIADNIVTNNSPEVFDHVAFEGLTPPNYTIAIVTHPHGKAVRLTIQNAGCDGVVTNTFDAGIGSFRAALGCIVEGGEIVFSPMIEGDTIKLTSLPLVIDKSIIIKSTSPQGVFLQNCTPGSLSTLSGKSINFENFTIMSDVFVNNAILTNKKMVYINKLGNGHINLQNSATAVFNVTETVIVK